jgi:D-sedoheptulose 7-phosphate isomerase
MKERISELLRESIETKQKFIGDANIATINKMVDALIGCVQSGHKLLICGNGGSASDAQHFAGEFIGRFQLERPAMAAIAIGTDMATLTAISNDFGFEAAYEREVDALGREGDVLFILSTSGNSPNLVKAVNAAKKRKMVTMGLLGRDGGVLKPMLDISTIVASQKSARIQEIHITVIHIICDIIENYFFAKNNVK